MDNKRVLSMRIALAMSIFALFSMAIVYGWAFDDGQSQKTISGTVVDMDWVKSTITVRYSDPFSGNVEEINIIVPPEAKITNGTSTMPLSDIDQSDPVTVTYYDDGAGGLKATKISDLNEGNR